MEENSALETAPRGKIGRIAACFVGLPAAVKNVVATAEFGLSVGCIWAAWTAGGDMALIVPALTLGLFFGIVGIATIQESRWGSKSACMCGATILFVGIGIFLYFHFQPKPVEVASAPAPKQPIATPIPVRPKIGSTYAKVIIECDNPKPEKPLSKKERQTRLDQQVDLLKKVWGYTATGKATEDEITLDITYSMPVGSPVLQIKRETWFVKRSEDKLFVTISKDYTGIIAYMLPLAQLDAEDPTIKSTVEQARTFTQTAPDKCKAL